MQDYHVACRDGEIVAGSVLDGEDYWEKLSVVTEDALKAVRDWFLWMRGDTAQQVQYKWFKKDGGYVALVLAETFEDEAVPEEVRDV